MKFLFTCLIVLAISASLSLACDKEAYVKETFFYVDGKQQKHGDGKLAHEMILSSSGIVHHKRMRKAVFDVFNRPKANVVFLVDESTSDCTTVPRKIQNIGKRFWNRLSRHGKQPFVASFGRSIQSASWPVKSMLNKGANVRIAHVDEQKQSIVLQNTGAELYHFTTGGDSMDVSAELESVKVVARKLMEQKSDSETSNLAPDFYFFTISSLKTIGSKLGKQSVEYAKARQQIIDSLPQLLAHFGELYPKERVVAQLLFNDERVNTGETHLSAKKRHTRKLMGASSAFVFQQVIDSNGTSNGTSNSTISPYDIADYQIWVWVWIITIALLIVGFYVTGTIEYGADCLNYAYEFSSD